MLVSGRAHTGVYWLYTALKFTVCHVSELLFGAEISGFISSSYCYVRRCECHVLVKCRVRQSRLLKDWHLKSVRTNRSLSVFIYNISDFTNVVLLFTGLFETDSGPAGSCCRRRQNGATLPGGWSAFLYYEINDAMWLLIWHKISSLCNTRKVSRFGLAVRRRPVGKRRDLGQFRRYRLRLSFLLVIEICGLWILPVLWLCPSQ